MTSCSSDRRGTDRTRHPFLAADRGAWVRLAVVLAFAVGALLAPVADATHAQFTDSSTLEVVYRVPSTPTPAPSPTTTAPPEQPAAPGPGDTTDDGATADPATSADGTAGRRPGPGAPRPEHRDTHPRVGEDAAARDR